MFVFVVHFMVNIGLIDFSGLLQVFHCITLD